MHHDPAVGAGPAWPAALTADQRRPPMNAPKAALFGQVCPMAGADGTVRAGPRVHQAAHRPGSCASATAVVPASRRRKRSRWRCGLPAKHARPASSTSSRSALLVPRAGPISPRHRTFMARTKVSVADRPSPYERAGSEAVDMRHARGAARPPISATPSSRSPPDARPRGISPNRLKVARKPAHPIG